MKDVAAPVANHAFASIVHDILDNTSSVIYVKDVEFRYLMINRQFEMLFHLNRQDVVGKTDFDIFSTASAEGFRANDQQVLETGEPLQCEEVAPQDDGHHHFLTLKFPLRDSNGLIYAVAGISTDITDRIRAQREIAFLQYRQHLILESVEDGICGLDSSGRVVFLNAAAERMLQWSTSEVLGRSHSRFTVNTRSNGRHGGDVASNPIEQVLMGGTAIRIDGAKFVRRDQTLLPVDYTVAPVHDVKETVGAVIAFRDTTDRLKQIETEQEIQTARRIQASLNPKRLPSIPGFDFAILSLPCSKACGDYYDFIPWGEDSLGLAVGDVSGHGVGAALEMVETRAILRTTMLNERDPVQCLTQLNKFLSDDLPDDMFVTLFLARLDILDRTMTYSSAGHDAVILSANGEIRRLESTGTILGLDRDAVFKSGITIDLHQDDILLIATDGLMETFSPHRELFGRIRIEELLQANREKSAGEILNAIQSATEAFRERELQRDDITAIVLKVT